MSQPDADDLVIASFNFEQNGGGDPLRRRAAYALLNHHGVHLLFRQEMPGADPQHAQMYEAEQALGLRGWLGEGNTGLVTAVFADPAVFVPLGHWPTPWNGFKIHPAAVALQLRAAGPESTPIIAVAAHLNHASAVLREIEAGWLTTFNDKWITLPSGRRPHAAVIAGLDGNSHPRPNITVGPSLPQLSMIEDLPHRVHRSRIGPVEVRVMDQVPHQTLHTAGIEDIASHPAQTTNGTSLLDPTMLACPSHGPDTRVDWLTASRHLLPAFHDLTVIDAQHISDHQIVIARASRSALARLLSEPAA